MSYFGNQFWGSASCGNPFCTPRRCCNPAAACCPPQTNCACIPNPTPAQNGNVLTVVNGRYAPLPPTGMAADFEGEMRPSDLGTLAWDYAPMFMDFQVTQSGFIYLAKIFIHEPLTVTSIVFAMSAEGALTPGQNFAGIYTATGTRIVQSEDQSSNWLNAVGFIASPIPSTTLEPGSYFIAFLYNATEGSVGAIAKQACAFQEITAGFDSLALLSATDTNTSLPLQFALSDFSPEFECNYLWAGLA